MPVYMFRISFDPHFIPLEQRTGISEARTDCGRAEQRVVYLSKPSCSPSSVSHITNKFIYEREGEGGPACVVQLLGQPARRCSVSFA